MSSDRSLRTVPVILKHKDKQVKVNALLDDASSNSYINEHVAVELGLHGYQRKVNVNVINDSVQTIDSCDVNMEIESVDGKYRTELNALTTHKVTGDMHVTDWREERNKWNHLCKIDFPHISKRSVDLLIGVNNTDLHFAKHDVRGQKGEPIARLTPLGWTCIYGTVCN